MPATLDFASVCRALRISQGQGYKLIAARTFPVSPMPHSSRLYALADVIRYLGFDPADAGVVQVPRLTSRVPAGMIDAVREG